MKTLRNINRAKKGIMLVECMIYCAVVMVLIGFSLAAFYQCEKSAAHLRKNCQQIESALNAGERWRSDVHLAIDSPNVEKEENATIFHIPQGIDEVVYIFENGVLWRKPENDKIFSVFLEDIQACNFFPEQRGDVKGWRLEVRLKSIQKAVKTQPLFTFLAVTSLPDIGNKK